MSVHLQRGANTSLQQALAEHGSRIRVVLEWFGDNPDTPSVEAAAFLLTETGTVRTDSDMIFYNNLVDAAGFITMTGSGRTVNGGRIQSFVLNLDKVPSGIERVAFCLALQSGQSKGLYYMNQLSKTSLGVLGGSAEVELVQTDINLDDKQENALVLGEVYLRKGEWKVKCVAQGFVAGLHALAENFGVVVAEAAQAAESMTRATIPLTSNSAVSKSAAPSIQFDPPQGGFTDFQVVLNWGEPPAPVPSDDLPPPSRANTPRGKGLLGGLFGGAKDPKAKGADLDLCCLFELSDGYRGVVQALGDHFGGYQTAPYVELQGDERQGGGSQSEIMVVNGKKWVEIKRLLFFAMIFKGAPNWSKANGRARILVPDQVPISVRLDQPTVDRRVCSIALVENEGGKIVVHKRVETFKNPRELDTQYGWGLRWSAGTKD